MSRSIFTRANSARKRLISFCSAVTPDLPLTSFNFPSRRALTQFDSVCSTTPRLRPVSAMLWPNSTSRTASCLNSSVYLPRFPFLTCVSLRYYSSSLGVRFARARSWTNGSGGRSGVIHWPEAENYVGREREYGVEGGNSGGHPIQGFREALNWVHLICLRVQQGEYGLLRAQLDL